MTAKRILLALGCAVLAIPSLVHGAVRPHSVPGQSRGAPHPMTSTIQVQPADLNQVLQCLMGPNVAVSNAVLTAGPGATGTFTGGTTVFGIGQGVVLSSGSATSIVGPNLADDTSTDNGLPGDPDLDALIPGYTTYDATILEFDFECSNPTAVSFQYVFASEEYNEWVDSPFNDVFAFFLNGVNIAAAPAICSSGGIPVAINNVNCGNPYAPPGGSNCDCYRNNALPDGTLDTEMDGMTQVFYATGQIQPGLNHMKIAIADAGDHILDSNVMLHCQSFDCGAPPKVGGCCVGDECYLLGSVDCADEGGTYLGDGKVCYPSPCSPTPARKVTWGRVKTIYR
jgi:hypothetical protein